MEAPPFLYEDEHLLVVDKPAGIASVPSPGVRGASLAEQVARVRPGARPAHRLDLETSGAILFARSERVLEALIELFRERRVEKRYLALVRGTPRPPEGEVRLPIARADKRAVVAARGQPALTRYRVLRQLGAASLVEARPETGRYNQVRLHLAAIGHPLLGDRKYGLGRGDPVRLRRTALHAAGLRLPHPVQRGRVVEVESPLAADLEEALAQLESGEQA